MAAGRVTFFILSSYFLFFIFICLFILRITFASKGDHLSDPDYSRRLEHAKYRKIEIEKTV